MAKRTQAKGRPKGAKNCKRKLTTSLPAACPVCNSTRRQPYKDGIVAEYYMTGEIDGRPYNRVIWRRTRCLDCDQNLTVREYLFEPA